MPWTPTSAKRHTKKAKSPRLRKLWSRVANDALGRGANEGSAVRQANAVISRQKGGRMFDAVDTRGRRKRHKSARKR